MECSTFTCSLETWLTVNFFRLLITSAVIVIYLVAMKFTRPRLQESADEGGFKEGAATQATNIVRAISSTFGILIIAIVWGIDFGAIMLFASTTLTLLGVALFASWSILSNITACVILLLHPAFRRGTFIRVIDADNYAEGYISELTLFNTKLVTESREVIYYPNNQLLGRPSIINPRDRLDGIGKLKPAAIEEQIPTDSSALK